jgi:hypothetical protein
VRRPAGAPSLYSGHPIKETLETFNPFFAAHRLWLCQYAQ